MRHYTVKEDINADAIIDAIAIEKQRIMANINDRRADPKKERKTVLTIHYKPDVDSGSVMITADIGSTLAPLKLKEVGELACQISFDDVDYETGEVMA